ncbi:MAG: DUF2185 domain-containing protein [Sphingopyxis sp.]
MNGPELNGKLETQPDEAYLTLGEFVIFTHGNIIDIVWAEPDLAPLRDKQRDYWDRCLVDECILDADVKVEYIYRESRTLTEEGDQYPDSGLRIRGAAEGATDEEIDQRAIAYVALGAVLNRDDSWLPLIDEPEGCAFMRNFDTGEYLRVEQ